MTIFYLYRQLMTPHVSGFSYRGLAWWESEKLQDTDLHQKKQRNQARKSHSAGPSSSGPTSSLFTTHTHVVVHIAKFICSQMSFSPLGPSFPPCFSFPSPWLSMSMRCLDVDLPLRPTPLLSFLFVESARVLPVLPERHRPGELLQQRECSIKQLCHPVRQPPITCSHSDT